MQVIFQMVCSKNAESNKEWSEKKQIQKLNWTLHEKFPYSELFWSVFSRIQSDCGKMRTRITPNMETFYAMEATLYSGQFLLRDPEGYFCFDYSSGELNESNFSVTANNYSRESVVPHAWFYNLTLEEKEIT